MSHQKIVIILSLWISSSVFAGGTTSVGPDVKGKQCTSRGGVVLNVEHMNNSSNDNEKYSLCQFGYSRIELSTFAKRYSANNYAVQAFLSNHANSNFSKSATVYSDAIQFCENLNGELRTVYNHKNKTFYGTCFFKEDSSEIGLETLYLGADHPSNSKLFYFLQNNQ